MRTAVEIKSHGAPQRFSKTNGNCLFFFFIMKQSTHKEWDISESDFATTIVGRVFKYLSASHVPNTQSSSNADRWIRLKCFFIKRGRVFVFPSRGAKSSTQEDPPFCVFCVCDKDYMWSKFLTYSARDDIRGMQGWVTCCRSRKPKELTRSVMITFNTNGKSVDPLAGESTWRRGDAKACHLKIATDQISQIIGRDYLSHYVYNNQRTGMWGW